MPTLEDPDEATAEWKISPAAILTLLAGTFLLALLMQFTRFGRNPVEVFSQWQCAVNFLIFWATSFVGFLLITWIISLVMKKRNAKQSQ